MVGWVLAHYAQRPNHVSPHQFTPHAGTGSDMRFYPKAGYRGGARGGLDRPVERRGDLFVTLDFHKSGTHPYR